MAGTRATADATVGELQSVDGYMNIALEQTKEFTNGKLRRNYGDAFVRGNNGEASAPQMTRHAADRFSVMYISADS